MTGEIEGNGRWVNLYRSSTVTLLSLILCVIGYQGKKALDKIDTLTEQMAQAQTNQREMLIRIEMLSLRFEKLEKQKGN